MDEVEKTFCGTWLYDRDENLRKSMEDSNIPKDDIDFLMTTKPTMKIMRQGNKFFHSTELMKDVKYDITYELGKEFEQRDTKSDPPLFHNKVLCTFENGKLTYESRSQLTGPRKIDSLTVMYVKDDELISDTSPLSDHSIVGKRIYKKA